MRAWPTCMADSNQRSARHVAQTFPGSAPSVRAARHFCRDQFSAWVGEDGAFDVDAMELIASELITNAVVAGASFVRVELSHSPTTIRIAVHDDAMGFPEPRPASATDPHGRGLALVDGFSTRYGIEGRPGAKCVWAELGTS